jgi:hypothetical protein
MAGKENNMPLGTSDLFLRPGNLVGMGSANIHGDDAEQQARPGTASFIADAFGPRILRYVQNRNGSALVVGDLVSYASDTQNTISTSVANITSGTTTSAVTSGLTADRHNGMICWVLDNADSAGAAPEGEWSVVADNTATAINVDPQKPYSVALAANDDLELLATYQVEDSADGDEGWTVVGVAAGKDGISVGNYGWVVAHGFTMATHTTNAITEGDPIVAGAAVVDAFGTDGQELWVGIACGAGSTDETLKHLPVHMRVWHSAGPGGSP